MLVAVDCRVLVVMPVGLAVPVSLRVALQHEVSSPLVDVSGKTAINESPVTLVVREVWSPT
jgi:hypothetical protein